jgi:hypothetical protein
MDKREMKKALKFWMIERMQVDLPNQFGERPQDLFLEEVIPKRKIGSREFSSVSQAHRRRLRKLVEEMYRAESRNLKK